MRGVAHELVGGDLTDLTEVARSRLTTTWIDGAPEHLVVVSIDLVTGRRLR